ncbi:hypothetical protein IAT40_005993 [Kwoniella sp. CBS 6097]
MSDLLENPELGITSNTDGLTCIAATTWDMFVKGILITGGLNIILCLLYVKLRFMRHDVDRRHGSLHAMGNRLKRRLRRAKRIK